jgi:hypothetical protein
LLFAASVKVSTASSNSAFARPASPESTSAPRL